MRLKQVSLAAVALAIMVPAQAQAQDAQDQTQDLNDQQQGGIQEIVVTAQKRVENVQDVPIAISAFSAAALQERGVSDVSELSNIAPNVTLDAGTPFSGSSSVLSAFIRGIGANDFAFNIDPGVGVYLDGVYLARSVGANQDLADVERIEVLKGPQGTLFGRNTIGGAISIVTRDPGDEFRFAGDVTVGRFNKLQGRGTVDLPITDGLASSVAFSIKTEDGYLKRIPFPGNPDFNVEPITNMKAAGYHGAGYGTEGGETTWSLRGKLRWDNGGRVRVVLSGDYSDVDQEQIANTVLGIRAAGTAVQGATFAAAYNCAIEGQVVFGGPVTCNGDAINYNTIPTPAYAYGVGGQNTIIDLPAILGVNADGNPDNDRVPYDERFLTDDIDTSYANGNNFSHLKTYGASGTVSFDLSDNVELKSITAYRELHWVAGMDLDGSPLNFLHTSFEMNQWQFSEELQLLGSAMNNSLNYVLGAYYFKEAGDLHDYVTFAEGLLQVDGPNDLATENYAFFGQVDWRLSDLIGITVGGRYTHENKTFEGAQSDANGLDYKIAKFVGAPGCDDLLNISEACRASLGFPNPGEPLRYYIAGTQEKVFNNFSPKIGVQLHPNDDVMVYASWSKGYKTGGWTTRLSAPLPTAPDFNEEKATTYEVGLKSQFLDRILQVNAAVFQTDYKGIQLNFQQGVSPTIQNAGDARIRGAEVEVVVAPTNQFTLNGSIGYLDAVYTSVDGPAQVAPDPDPEFGRVGVFAGATLPKTPEWKFNISPRYEIALGNGGDIVLLGDYTHTSSLKNDTEGYFMLTRDATDMLNASIQYRAPSGNWTATVGGTNLLDERYLVTGQAQTGGGIYYGTYSRPTEWYARLGFEF